MIDMFVWLIWMCMLILKKFKFLTEEGVAILVDLIPDDLCLNLEFIFLYSFLYLSQNGSIFWVAYPVFIIPIGPAQLETYSLDC